MRARRLIITAILVVLARFNAVADQSAASSIEPDHDELALLESVESGVPRGARGTVAVRIDESIEVHSRRDDMARICRAPYPVKGCTDFPIEKLVCRCKLQQTGWFIDASAILTAAIHIPNTFEMSRLLHHERAHIADLNESLHKYLESITSREFESENTCERFARFLSTSAHLRIVMNELRVKSNEKFGCSRAASVKTAHDHGRRG